jgi:hypothetical protein
MTTLAHNKAIDDFVINKEYHDKNFKELVTAKCIADMFDLTTEFENILWTTGYNDKTPIHIQQRNQLSKFLKQYRELELCEIIKNDFNRVPDCFRFTDCTIEVMEVYDTAPATKSRVIDYAILDDVLCSFFGNKIRIRLFEYSVKFKSTIEHDLVEVFDEWELNQAMINHELEHR